MAGGTVMPTDVVNEICEGAHKAGLPVHMDGARIFNASAALNQPVAEMTKNVDSVMFCLSKGLGAPVGSLLVGARDFIKQARIHRKSLGGGMRQGGILAAAGLIALEHGPKRLHEDHANAKFIAEKLAHIRGLKIDTAPVQTNILIFDISGSGMTTADFSRRLAEKNVLANGISPERMRFVTHLDVDRAACEHAVQAIEEICA
jgi:threonine aldolase